VVNEVRCGDAGEGESEESSGGRDFVVIYGEAE
jgi:hypothetical protein